MSEVVLDEDALTIGELLTRFGGDHPVVGARGFFRVSLDLRDAAHDYEMRNPDALRLVVRDKFIRYAVLDEAAVAAFVRGFLVEFELRRGRP